MKISIFILIGLKIVLCSNPQFLEIPDSFWLAKNCFSPCERSNEVYISPQSFSPSQTQKKKFPYGWGSAQKCLSFCCLSVASLSPIIFWTVGLIVINFFWQKTRENVYLRISIHKFRGQHPRGKALG